MKTSEREQFVFEIENALAVAKGWEPVPDLRRGWRENIPWCKFHKGAEVVWSAYPRWVRATRTETNVFINHKYYKSLEDALGEVNAEPR
jgi:hypothetical protein